MDEFETVVFTPQVHTELDDKPTEWVSENRCIYCNADETMLDEAEPCAMCEEWFPIGELVSRCVCRQCLEEAAKQQGPATEFALSFLMNSPSS